MNPRQHLNREHTRRMRLGWPRDPFVPVGYYANRPRRLRKMSGEIGKDTSTRWFIANPAWVCRVDCP